MRFAAVASAIEAMVWESETDGNPSVDADELPNDKVTEPREQPTISNQSHTRILDMVH